MHFLRRSFLFGAGALAAAPLLKTAAPRPAFADELDYSATLTYPYAVPPLAYAYDVNEPAIDAMTMQIHHDKHHAAYVSNLNASLKDHPDWQGKPLQDLLAHVADLPDAIRTTVRNNAGGHANHTMYWQILGGKGGEPDGDLAAAIARDFGSFARLQEDFNKAGAKVFGSGWAMVLADARRQALARHAPQSGFSATRGQARAFRQRRLGACLLPENTKTGARTISPPGGASSAGRASPLATQRRRRAR